MVIGKAAGGPVDGVDALLAHPVETLFIAKSLKLKVQTLQYRNSLLVGIARGALERRGCPSSLEG